MSASFDRWVGWVVDRPVWAVLLLVSLTAVATLGYVDAHLVTDLFKVEAPGEESAEESAQVAEPLPDVEPVNLTDSHAVLLIESDDFFTAPGAQALRHIVDELESQEYIRSVMWMDRVPLLNIFGLPEPLFPRSEASPERYAAAKDKALAHPLVAGQLLSEDGRTLLMLVNFDLLFLDSDDDCITGLRGAAEAAAAEFPDVDFSFGVTGRVPIYVTARRAHEENSLRFQLIGYGMILLMAVILFRGVIAVIVVALAPALGVFWTLGMLRYFDLQDNPFNDVVVPVLLSLVGLTDGVHLMVQIRRLRATGLAPRAAARQGIREVGLACGLTSLTTAIGFGSLTLAHHKVVQEFGLSCVLGVLLTFVAVVTVIPLACSTWLGWRVNVGHERGLIDRHLGRIGGLVDFVLARRTFFARLGIGSTFLFVAIALTLRPDERAAATLSRSSEPARTMVRMDRALGGLEPGHVDVWWSPEIEATDPRILTVVGSVDAVLRDEELIGHPISIRNLLDALPGDRQAADRMSMLELLPPPLKRALYTPERRHARVAFRVQDLGIATYGPVFERIQAGLADLHASHPEFTFELAGRAVWRWENLYQIVVDLALSLGTAMLVIFVVLAIVYRSVRIGLISIIPNLFPLAITATLLVIVGQSLEVVSVCAFTVCLGIAVDDTIHFLTRFQEERARGRSDDEAIRLAFTGVGTALIMTTAVLLAGFATVMLSDLRDHQIFASMGGLTIASALFADLVFLPALLARYAPMRGSGAMDQGSGHLLNAGMQVRHASEP